MTSNTDLSIRNDINRMMAELAAAALRNCRDCRRHTFEFNGLSNLAVRNRESDLYLVLPSKCQLLCQTAAPHFVAMVTSTAALLSYFRQYLMRRFRQRTCFRYTFRQMEHRLINLIGDSNKAASFFIRQIPNALTRSFR